MKKSKEYWVKHLNLSPHPEGGFYKETYRSDISVKEIEGFPNERSFSTAIYFLLEANNFSAFHRIKSDEIWHFYDGDPLVVHMIDLKGNYSFQKIGLDLEKDEIPQFVVPANYWFASEVETGGDYSFVGCTVSPGFDFNDFELAKLKELAKSYSNHAEIIEKLCRE